MTKSELVDVVVVLRHETTQAVLIDHGGKKPCWLPKSQIEIEKNDDNKTYTVTLPQWLAEEKEIV